jgi:uncharacterized protein (TIGR01319 family)
MSAAPVKPEVLVAEIGSTTTVVSGFAGLKGATPCFLGQGVAPTSVQAGDVRIGLREARQTLSAELGVPCEGIPMMACSSAAGGLRMTVHGLVHDMTVRAGREAALGAGAIIKMISAGEMTESDLEELERVRPNIILLAGGTDYGDRNTVIANARRIAQLGLKAPVIYAGNIAARSLVKATLEDAGIACDAVDNVYPSIDQLVVEPTRKAIQRAFERHITGAPGMEFIRDEVEGDIVPVPYAVMTAAELLYNRLGDLVVLDVGGATTDVHSVTPGSEAVNRVLTDPEPFAKRTVEGDLGVYVNARNVADLVPEDEVRRACGATRDEMLSQWEALPKDNRDIEFLRLLTEYCVKAAMLRHAGRYRYLYGPTGRVTQAKGKDLTQVRYIIGTGGPLTRHPQAREILGKIPGFGHGEELLPPRQAQVLIDSSYIMAAAGVLSRRFPEAAMEIICQSLGLTAERGG